MKKILIILITFVASISLSYSQVVVCNISVSPTDTVICPGDSVFISAIASITAGGQSFDFDTGTLPPGWSTSGTTSFSTPCGPGPNGSSYFWAASAGAATPLVSTAAFDVGCGGSINFDMVFAVQGGAAPCEGPDLANEGVELQYSIDGGLTWITIVYYSPGGFELPNNPGTAGSVATGATPYTTWNTFSVPIPLAAQTPGTMFQWIQTNSSGTCCDNWGLENISIQAGPCASAVVDWNNGLNDTTGFWAAPPSDTAYIAYVYDTLGVLQCISDSIFVNVSTLSVDSVGQLPASSCMADGMAYAMVSGVDGTPNYLWADSTYNVSAPLGSSVSTIQWNDISPGWYYFTVTDDYCTDNDSVFVEMIDPPIADFSATVTSGCTPLTVMFTNNSQNSTTYDWDFGNGNQVLGTGMGPQSETFTNTSSVTLTAYDVAGCSDAAVIGVTIIQCGCTDPNAINYDPLAAEDDGSCILPDPEVEVPNVFTPNADGDNDVFILNAQNYTNIDLTITNRWGNVMYSASGTNPSWNGLNNGGGKAKAGTYFYTYVVTGIDNMTTVEGHGFLQLIRED